MSNVVAKDGTVFICAACGKRSQDKYGDQAIDDGWDESCMMHAVLCYDQRDPRTYKWQVVDCDIQIAEHGGRK